MNDRDKADEHSESFAEILNLWVSLTGSDRQAKSLNLRGFQVEQMHRELHEALELDPSDATAFMLLDGFRKSYFDQRVFTLSELTESPEATGEYVAKVASLRDKLRSPSVAAIGDGFVASAMQAVTVYGAANPEVTKIIEDRFTLAILRRDALRSMRKLRVDQFLRGAPEPEGYRPVYAKSVHQFWNVNSLLRSACNMPSGVSLNLIRDPDAFQSYFVFAIRNGGNLFLLSDTPEHANPLQRYNSRRPDRDLDRRASRNWFPYSLLGLAYDEESGEAYIRTMHEGGIIPYQQQAFPLKRVADLDPAEVVWTTMMFDLVVRRFWREGVDLPQLSYTGEMVRVSDALSSAAASSKLPVAVYHAIDASPITVADVRTGAVDEAAVGSVDTHNLWLEERYAHLVGDATLNLLTTSATGHVLLGTRGAAVVESGSGRQEPSFLSFDKERNYTLRAFDPTSFGPKERILGDRIFIARHNLALGIQRLADQEYASRKDDVAAWYKEKVDANLLALLEAAACGEMWHPAGGDGDFLIRNGTTRGKAGEREYRFMETVDLEEKEVCYYSSVYISGGFGGRGNKTLCRVNCTQARFRIAFNPQHAGDLAFLTGCPLAEMPDVLRHWDARDHQRGNSILDRIDPMGWALTDPWSKMTVRVSLFLSARALAAAKKRNPRTPRPEDDR